MFQRVPEKKVVLFFTGAAFRSATERSKLLIIKKKEEEEVIIWNRNSVSCSMFQRIGNRGYGLPESFGLQICAVPSTVSNFVLVSPSGKRGTLEQTVFFF